MLLFEARMFMKVKNDCEMILCDLFGENE